MRLVAGLLSDPLGIRAHTAGFWGWGRKGGSGGKMGEMGGLRGRDMGDIKKDGCCGEIYRG